MKAVLLGLILSAGCTAHAAEIIEGRVTYKSAIKMGDRLAVTGPRITIGDNVALVTATEDVARGYCRHLGYKNGVMNERITLRTANSIVTLNFLGEITEYYDYTIPQAMKGFIIGFQNSPRILEKVVCHNADY